VGQEFVIILQPVGEAAELNVYLEVAFDVALDVDRRGPVRLN